MTAIQTIEFHGATLWGFEDEGGVWVAMPPICAQLGLDAEGQRQRITRNPILAEGTCMMQVPSGRGMQETTCLRLDLLNGWLFGVDVNRIKDEAVRERVITYQRECYRVLAAHFMADKTSAAAPIDTNDPGQALPLTEINTKLRMMENYGKRLGLRAWKELWSDLGLPTTPSFHNAGYSPRANPDLNFGDAFAAILSAEIPAARAGDRPGADWVSVGQVVSAYLSDALTREQANRALGRLGLRLKHRRGEPQDAGHARLFLPSPAPRLNAALQGMVYASGSVRAAALLAAAHLSERDKHGGTRGVSVHLSAAVDEAQGE